MPITPSLSWTTRILSLALALSALATVFLFVLPPPHAYAATYINVNTTADVVSDADGVCSLREAVIAVNNGSTFNECVADSSTQTIFLPVSTITLTIAGSGEDNAYTGDLDIKKDVTITSLSVRRGVYSIINANGIDRAFDIFSPAHVTLSQIQIQGGNEGGYGGGGLRNAGILTLSNVLLIANYSSSVGGGLYVQSGGSATLTNVGFGNNVSANGGGIMNSGVLTMTHSSLTWGNAAASHGGAIFNGGTATLTDATISNSTAGLNGGGIYSPGDLTLQRSVIAQNQATGGNGGGLWSSWMFTLTNVTLSSNMAISTTSKGGAIYKSNWPPATLLNVTVYSNTASSGGGVYRDATSGAVTITNTILAGSASGGNCGGSAITSRGYNLDSGNTCALSAAGDITNTNPLLGPLASNGGATQTHALLTNSPAIDAGTNTGCPTTDQRGNPRPVGTRCDMGAFEFGFNSFLPHISKR